MLAFFERLWAILALCCLSGAPLYLPILGVETDTPIADVPGLDSKIQRFYIGGYVIVLLLVMVNVSRVVRASAVVWPMILLAALAAASVAWSADPAVTQSHSVSLAMTILLGVYLVGRYDLAELSIVLIAAFSVLMFASIAIIVIDPASAFHVGDDHEGSLRGVFVHKNQAGRIMILMIPAIAAAWMLGALSKATLAFLGLLAVGFVAATTSKTALVAGVAMIAAVVIVPMLRGTVLQTAVTILILATALWWMAVISVYNYEAALTSIGRDASFTGRTDIWAFVVDHIAQRPLGGWGYSAFWHGDFMPGERYTARTGVPHGHNGWLDVMVDVGVLGVAILALAALVTLARGLALARHGRSRAPAAFVLSVLAGWLAIGATESIYLTKHDIYTVMFVLAVGCSRAIRRRQVSSAAHRGSRRPAARIAAT